MRDKPKRGKFSKASQKTNPPTSEFKIKCPMNCSVGHMLNTFSKFRVISLNEKWNNIRGHKICSKCLYSGHMQRQSTYVNGGDVDEAVLSKPIVE